MKQLMKKGVFNTNWRKNLKKSLLPDETLTTDDEFKKRVLLLMKKSHQKSMNLDDPSNEERNRLIREERCFKCKGYDHRAHDCPPDDEKKEPDNRSTPTKVRAIISKLYKQQQEKMLEKV